MSARKARKVIGFADGKATLADDNGHVLTVKVESLVKVDLMALAKFLGIEFVGRPPMAFSPDHIREVIAKGEKKCIYGTFGAARSAVTTPTATVATRSGSLDAALAGLVERMVRETVAATPSPVDMVAVDGSIAKAIDGFRHEVTAMVDDMRPKVTHVTVAPRTEPVVLNGIQHREFGRVLQAVTRGVPMWLVGPAGSGKTTIAERVAEALGLQFRAVNCTSTMTEYALKGYMDAQGRYVQTDFRDMFANGGLFVLDEIDNANPNVLGALNSALANGYMAFADGLVKRHADFRVVACANTYGAGATAEYVGRNPIDAATVNRFVRWEIGYDDAVERDMLDGVGLDATLASVWLKAIVKSRENVAKYGLKVIVSPRATKYGAEVMLGGWSMEQAYEGTVLAGLKADQRAKVSEGVALV